VPLTDNPTRRVKGGIQMEGFRILVVDDEDDFRDTLVQRLQNRKMDVTGAENGEKALELIDKFLYDVVILDVKMPGLDGIQVLREIRQRRPSIEVILLTGHASVESGIEGMKLGAFDYVVKPVGLDKLLEIMQAAYDKKHTSDERTDQATVRDLVGHPARILETIRKEKKNT
jgi:DNA-binding NtrC family response regulator